MEPTIKHLTELYLEQCWGPTKIAQEFNVSPSYIGSLLAKYGIPRRANSEAQVAYWRAKRQETGKRDPGLEQLCELYLEQKLSAMKTAPILGCTIDHVYYLLNKYNIPRRKPTDPLLKQVARNNLPKDVAGENNPRWKGPIIHICVICGNEFEKDRRQGPSHIYKTCSDKCLVIRKSQNTSGENNPIWKGGLETIACLNCRQKFEAPPSSHRKFHTLNCRNEYWQKHPSETPNWQGGISQASYPHEFDKNYKEQIRQRDNYQCQICGLSREEQKQKHRRAFSVHHVDYDKDNLDPKNLIALCDSCHSKTHHNRPHWQSFFEAKIKQIYS